MSSIPPNFLGSILQAQGAKARAAADRQQEHAAEVERTGASFADKLQDVIDETDRDSQVYSDAEGSGSQGRPSEPPPQEPPTSTEEDAADQAGLDLQA
jgi:hypothetical protein